MQTVIQSLSENMQLIYRKAIDADAIIKTLQGEGKGKHQAIFAADSGFSASSKFFKPYVEELAIEVAALVNTDPESLKVQLPGMVKKVELLHSTLGKFKLSVRK